MIKKAWNDDGELKCAESSDSSNSKKTTYEGAILGRINGLTEVSRCYRDLLEPIAKYALTRILKLHAPRIASGTAFNKKVSYVDIDTDVGRTEPAIEGLTAIYDDKIIASMKDYQGFHVTCFGTTREAAKEWVDKFENVMRTQNQYRGKCLYASNGGMDFSDIPKVNWDDVVLGEKIKNDIRLNTVTFLGDEKLANVGVTKRGLIMYGPPGTGKTSVVKSIFNELEGKKVSRIYVTNESFKFMPVSSLFDLLGYLGPTVMAFEDIDMVGTSRNITASSGGPLGDLLTNLDGMRKYHDPLVVIASTNKIEMMDEALANRPCRFDRKIEIGLPTGDLLRRLYAKFLGSEVSDEVVKMSSGFTGSHVFETVNTSKILAMNVGKKASECIQEACQIVKDNFFPGQTTQQIHVAAKKSIMKVSSRKGIVKTASKIVTVNVKAISDKIIKKAVRRMSDKIVSLYPEIEKMVKKHGGDFNKFIQAFDKMDGDYDKSNAYAVRDAISDALDDSGITFNYDNLTRLVVQKLNNQKL